MTSVLNLPPHTPSAPSSAPGTPMSGISTVAIKDGHEGHRPNNSFDGTSERLARLSSLNGASTSYFDVNRRPDTPSSVTSETDNDDTRSNSAKGVDVMGGTGPVIVNERVTRVYPYSTPETPSSAASETDTPLAADEARSRVVRHAIGAGTPGGEIMLGVASDIAGPRDGPARPAVVSATSGYFGAKRLPTVVGTPGSVPSLGGSPSDTPAAVDEARSRTIRQAIGAGTPGRGDMEMGDYGRDVGRERFWEGGVQTPARTPAADTPDSRSTTSSGIEQRQQARMIDGMTYDEGVTDTTNRTPPIVTNGEVKEL